MTTCSGSLIRKDKLSLQVLQLLLFHSFFCILAQTPSTGKLTSFLERSTMRSLTLPNGWTIFLISWSEKPSSGKSDIWRTVPQFSSSSLNSYKVKNRTKISNFHVKSSTTKEKQSAIETAPEQTNCLAHWGVLRLLLFNTRTDP